MSQRDLNIAAIAAIVGWLDSACIRVGSKSCSDGKGYGGSLLPDAVRWPRDTWKLEASLKCRSCPEGPLRSAGAHDQADRGPRDHALQVGASGRGAVIAWL